MGPDHCALHSLRWWKIHHLSVLSRNWKSHHSCKQRPPNERRDGHEQESLINAQNELGTPAPARQSAAPDANTFIIRPTFARRDRSRKDAERRVDEAAARQMGSPVAATERLAGKTMGTMGRRPNARRTEAPQGTLAAVRHRRHKSRWQTDGSDFPIARRGRCSRLRLGWPSVIARFSLTIPASTMRHAARRGRTASPSPGDISASSLSHVEKAGGSQHTAPPRSKVRKTEADTRAKRCSSRRNE